MGKILRTLVGGHDYACGDGAFIMTLDEDFADSESICDDDGRLKCGLSTSLDFEYKSADWHDGDFTVEANAKKGDDVSEFFKQFIKDVDKAALKLAVELEEQGDEYAMDYLDGFSNGYDFENINNLLKEVFGI